MSDEQIIEYLRSRGRAQPPVEFVGSVMAALDEVPPARAWFAGYMPALALTSAVALVAVLALLLGQGPNIGPGPAVSPHATEEATPASLDDLRGALTRATEELVSAPGVQGLQVTHARDYLATAVWFDWRANGDQVVVQRQDTDVTMTAWWLDPAGEPPAVGERVVTNIWVLVEDAFYASNLAEWRVADREDAPPLLAFGPGILSGQIDPLQPLEGLTPRLPDPEDGSVTVRHMADGGSVWTVTMPYRDGTGVAAWRIDANGALRSWSTDLIDVSPDPEAGNYYTSARLEFTPLTSPGPIRPPDVDAVPDPADFGLPADFPLSAD